MSQVGKMQLSNPGLRENFRVAAMMLAKANGIPVDNVRLDDLTQGFLRSPIDLQTNLSKLQFPMSTLDQASITGAPNIPITNLVAAVDAFVAGQMSYYLMIYSYSGGNQINMDFTTGNNFTPTTYPSPWENNGTGVNWDPGCMIFWLGYIKIEINSKILYKQWDLLRHYNAPMTQATPGYPTPSNYIPKQKNQYDGGQDGFYPMEPLPVFSGSKQNVVELYLPANIPTTIAPFNQTGIGYGTTFIAKAVLHFRGITCQNASGLK